MSAMRKPVVTQADVLNPSQPNEFDFRRIERALAKRRRYRYVTPILLRTANGYRIQSPCCSRNIDPDGGVVDIALLLYDEQNRSWRLLRKDHAAGVWEFDRAFERLAELLDYLNEDAERRFWQ
ncbi:MAG: hypothetical protein ACR65U_03745 [Methylocystis sp.]